jgi:hypothetical protein
MTKEEKRQAHVEALAQVGAFMVGYLMQTHHVSEQEALEKLISMWEEAGLHHDTLQFVVPEADDTDGDEYASYLDDFENEVICAIQEARA